MRSRGVSTHGEGFGRCTAPLALQLGARRRSGGCCAPVRRPCGNQAPSGNGLAMLNSRQGRVPLKFLPDEARSLPPPKLTDPRLLYLGFMGYCSGLLDNALRRRPVSTAGEGCAGGRAGGLGPAAPGARRRRRRRSPCGLGHPDSGTWASGEGGAPAGGLGHLEEQVPRLGDLGTWRSRCPSSGT